MIQYRNGDFFGEFSDDFFIEEVKLLIATSNKVPAILTPVRGLNKELAEIFSFIGFIFFPTVLTSTVLKKETAAGTYYVKIYHPIGMFKKLKERIAPKALRTFRKTFHAMKRGLKTPMPLGWCYLKREHKSILLTKEASGKSLYDLLIREKHVHYLTAIGLTNEDLIIKVAHEVASAHKAGIFFKDLHLGHIYISDVGIEFIDLDGIKIKRNLTESELARDISCLNDPDLPFSSKERMCFLIAYLEALQWNGIDKKRLVKKIEEFSLKRYKKWKV